VNGAEVVVEALRREGVTHVFGLPGTTIMHLLDALGRQQEIRYVSVRHEQVAAFMADGFARGSGSGSGRLAACLVSRGPGATNLTTGIHNSHAESIPVLVIVGQVGDDIAHREAFEEMDLVGLFRPMTKWAVEIHEPARIPELLQRAVRTALAGRPRPVMVSLPLNLLQEEVAEPVFQPCFRVPNPQPQTADLEAAADLLASSERPLVLVGGGGGAEPSRLAIAALAEAAELPVATTWARNAAFPNGHRLYVGGLGYGVLPVTEEALAEADVLLSFGCRFSEFTTRRWRAISGRTRLIQCDLDPDEIGRVYLPAVALIGDAGATARALAAILMERAAAPAPRGHRAAALRERYCRQAAMPAPVAAAGPGSGVPSAAVVEALRSVMARHQLTLLHDAASFGPWLLRYVGYERAGSFLGSAGGAMGWGFPAAMGVRLARPQEPVLCVSGDGAFWMVAQDLETAVRERIPVVTVITNNYAFGNTRDRQRLDHGGRYVGVFYGNPDFAAYARLLGAHGERVERAEDLVPAIERSLQSGLPAVVDVIQDRNEGLPPDLAPPRSS
jgi:acetolactate synthase-1/2/3 large subunit